MKVSFVYSTPIPLVDSADDLARGVLYVERCGETDYLMTPSIHDGAVVYLAVREDGVWHAPHPGPWEDSIGHVEFPVSVFRGSLTLAND